MAITKGPLAPSTLVVLADGLFALRRDRLYLCADPNLSELHFDRDAVGDWECFTIEALDGSLFRYAYAEPIDHPPSPARPLLIDTLDGYQIMAQGADSDLVTITWPVFSNQPITRYTLPDGSWIVDVDSTPDPDQPFLVYWFYPFDRRIHVWRLDRAGRRMFGYNLSDAEARSFLIARRSLGPAFTARLYMLAQDHDDRGPLALLGGDLCAAAEAGSAEALCAVLRRPLAFSPATVRGLADRAFHLLRAANRAQMNKAEAPSSRSAVAALSVALTRLDPALSGRIRDELQGELDLHHLFADIRQVPNGEPALHVNLYCQTVEHLSTLLDGASSLTIGIVLRPSKRSVEFHYVHSTGGIGQRVIDGLRYAYYVLHTHQAETWDRLAALDPLVQAWLIRFEVGDLPPDHERAVGFERRAGDTKSVLVPDSYYFAFKGFRQGWFSGDIPPWSKKATRFVWRGSTSGAQDLTRETLAQALRVRLCEVGRAIGPVADFGITGVVQARSDADAEDIALVLKDRGLWRENMPPYIMGAHKFLVEIDGNANSWGFFAKLLTGCCVLKVDSPFEQWFYDRIKPWIHYVPVAHDLSDLEDKVKWCLKHERRCRKIAENGLRLAESLGFEIEMAAAAKTFVSVVGKLK